MPSFLLDTNIISDLIRNPQGRILDKISFFGEDKIATNVIVASELRFGAEKKGSQNLKDRVDQILSRFRILPLSSGIDQSYARIRTELERLGTPIGGNDLLIAAHVDYLNEWDKSDSWSIVTANEDEFRRVAGLPVVNWLS